VQYDTAPGVAHPAMPGALTLCDPNVTWSPPSSNNWKSYRDDPKIQKGSSNRKFGFMYSTAPRYPIPVVNTR